MDPTTVASGSNSRISDSDQVDASNGHPSANTVQIDDPDINRPLAVRRVARKRRIPHRFGKESDLLPSAQLAAMSTYNEVVTPEPTPVPTPQPSPRSSRSTSPVFVNRMDPEPIERETEPNQFGLYRRFTEWPSVDPEDDITSLMLLHLLAQWNMAIAQPRTHSVLSNHLQIHLRHILTRLYTGS
jgi:hypothetical protein